MKLDFCVVFVLALLASVSQAESCGEKCTYTINNGKLTVTGTNSFCNSGGNWDTYPPWYSSRDSITEIEATSDYIGSCFFRDLTKATKASIDARQVRSYAFKSCSSLSSISFSRRFKGFDDGGSCGYVFDGCTSLSTITIPATADGHINSFYIFDGSSLASINVEEGNEMYTSNDGVLFELDRNKQPKNLIRYPPKKTTETYVIPYDDVNVKTGAFFGCEKIKTLNIKENSVDGYLLRNMASLERIEVASDNPKHVSDENGVLFTKDIQTLIRYPPAKTGETYSIPNTVQIIGSYAFEGCKNLRTINIPASLDTIRSSAFDNFPGLDEINVDKNNQNFVLDDVALISKEKDGGVLIRYPPKHDGDSYQIPDTVATIQLSAFAGSIGLKTITIPDSVKTIGGDAFKGCSGLESITISKELTDLGFDAFDGCTGLTTFNGGHTNDGVLFFKMEGQNYLVKYPSKKSEKNYVIPEETGIVSLAFESCVNLESVTIPRHIGVKSTLDSKSFVDCPKLTTVEYLGRSDPGTVSTFVNCPGIKTVYVPHDYQSDTFCGMQVTKRPAPSSSSSSSIVIPSVATTLLATLLLFFF